jgi:transcriptional regulator with XRE-family HTH domain
MKPRLNKFRLPNGNIDAVAWANEYMENVFFGTFLKNIRESDEISLEKLAKKTNLTVQYLQDIENKNIQTTAEIANKLGEALGYPGSIFAGICLNDIKKNSKLD